MIKFCSPVVPDFNSVKTYMEESLQSGQLSNFGPTYTKLHDRLMKELKVEVHRDIVFTTSGHTALMAAYSTLGIKRLVVPGYTFESTRVAATMQGIEVLLCDVNAHSGCLTTAELDKIPEHRYDGVVVVAALSTIPQLHQLAVYCRQKQKVLVVDGAATFGTPDIYNYGDAFCMSMHATKTFSVGECGAVITSRSNAQTVREYINFGFDKDRIPRGPGMNAKISEYTAAVALAVLDNLPPAIQRRKENAAIYRSELSGLCPPSFKEEMTVYQAFPIFLENIDKADKVRKKLRTEGVEILQYYRPLTHNLATTSSLYERNCCLPVHQNVMPDQIRDICKIIKTC